MSINQQEEALVLAAQNGDTNAFEKLYQLYYDKIYALIMMTVKNSADTEDILQLTFIKAWQNIGKLNDPRAFNTWLQRIALNESKSMLRKKRPDLSVDDEGENGELLQIESDLLLPQEYAERDDLALRLRRIIEELSVVQRDTILLYYYNEMSVEEIAQIMDCSEGTVKSRLFLARKAIKTEIEEKERKSGEKFFGVVMLPFGPMFNDFVRSQSLSPEAALRIWSTVDQSISGAAAASATGSAATGAAAKAGMSLGAKIAIAGLVGAAVISGTVFGVSQIIKPHEPAPVAVETSAPATEVQDVTESPTESPTEADYTEAFVSYLQILESYKGDIGIYDWQLSGYDSSRSVEARPVAFADIYGDSAPEMIFFSGLLSPEGRAFEADMHVFSYENGSVTEISNADFKDMAAADMTHYYLFTVKGEKALYCYHTMSDNSFNYHIDRFIQGEGENSHVLVKEEYLHRYYTEEHAVVTKLEMNGEAVSDSTYEAARGEVLKNVDTLLMAGYSGAVEDDVKAIMEAKGNTAMTYEEAVAFLKGNITEPTFDTSGASSDADETIFSTIADIYVSERADSGGSGIEITSDGRYLVLVFGDEQLSGSITLLSDEGNGAYSFGVTSDNEVINGEEFVYYPAGYSASAVPQKSMEMIRELYRYTEGDRLDTAYIVTKRGGAYRLSSRK